MKKTLLLSVAMLTIACSAFAGKDAATYEPINGIKCQNLWLMSRGLDNAEYEASIPASMSVKFRTAAISQDIVYVGSSFPDDASIVDEKGDKIDVASVEMYNAITGEYKGKLGITVDGKRLQGLLCGNQVGVDSFGNLWVAPLTGDTVDKHKIYSVDKTTGAAKLEGVLTKTNAARIDYTDVIGDITRVQANCTVMATGGAATAIVFRWSAPKGGDWEGGFEGDDSLTFRELYPSNQIAWQSAGVARLTLGEGDAAYDGDLFYTDAFVTYPTLYNTTGEIIDSFENASDMKPENDAANGVIEFKLCGKHFIAYVNNQHGGKNGGNEILVCELGAASGFEGMSKYWMIPATGLNPMLISDGGQRIHSIDVKKTTDKNGKEGVLLLTYKCNAGFGVYLIADKDFEMAGVENTVAGRDVAINVNGGVITTSEEASEIAVYNVAGQLVVSANNTSTVEAPSIAGTYIVKAMVNGYQIVKKIIL